MLAITEADENLSSPDRDDSEMELSIVMPAFNEGPVIREVIDDLRFNILDRVPASELVVVDDCSTDETYEILRSLALSDRRVKIERSARNQGHGPTIRRAFDLASGTWIFHLDSDNQFRSEDFWQLWPLRSKGDLILGIRTPRSDPFHRRALSRAVAFLTSLLAGTRISDANVPFRIVSQDLWKDVSPFLSKDVLIPSILVALASARRGWTILQTPVSHFERPHGPSPTLRPLRLMRFSMKALAQLLLFRLHLQKAIAARSQGPN